MLWRFAIMVFMTAATVKAAPQPPNFLVILVDDLGYGDLSCYGAKDLRTPHIDGLAERGMRFTNFYANSPVCSPTRASLLTGRYPERVGVPGVIRTHPEDNWGYLSPQAVLLPALLKPAGYHSAIIGKWHLGLEGPNRPNDRGFDHFHGWLGDMMDDYWTHRRHGINYMRLNEWEIDVSGHATDLFTQWAVDYLRSRKDKKEPFFLYLAYNAPHFPVQPPDEWLAKVKQREPGLSEKRAKLVAFIEHMDDGVGRVLAALKETDLEQNTVVLFISDNGGWLPDEANNGPLRSGKTHVYEGGIKVPMCAVWPGHISPKSRCDGVALTMDVLPTLLAVTGIKLPPGLDGVSFLPSLLGKDQPIVERDLFFIRREGWDQYCGHTIFAMRRGDWKLLQDDPFGPLELYNLKSDPLEQNNLLPHRRDVFKDMVRALSAHVQRGGQVPWQKAAE